MEEKQTHCATLADAFTNARDLPVQPPFMHRDASSAQRLYRRARTRRGPANFIQPTRLSSPAAFARLIRRLTLPSKGRRLTLTSKGRTAPPTEPRTTDRSSCPRRSEGAPAAREALRM